jgi:OmpA-OmpF porin, OOP family
VCAQPARLPAHNTLHGLSGGIHVVDAGSGRAVSARASMGLDLFRRRNFLIDGALHRHGGARLNVSVTPVEHLELALNTSVRGDQNDGASPQLIQTLGDTQLYGKGYARVLPWLTVGGDLQVALLNVLGGVGFQRNATSVGLRGSATFDLRELARPRPLIVRTSLGYFFDNSARLIRSLERYRYATLTSPAAYANEYRHLVTPVERFGYGINRLDHLSLAFGFEVPLAPKPNLYVHPLIEWNVQLPVNRQGYDCVITSASGDRDGCLASAGFAARTSTLTLGARIMPRVPGLALTAALDIATSGARTYVRDVAPNAPYAILLQAGYTFDSQPVPRPVTRVERVEVPIEIRRGHLLGFVTDDSTGAPVKQALVQIEGHALNAQATDDQGRFTSYPLVPGRYLLHVTHPGFEDAVCAGELRDDSYDAELRCPLTPKLSAQSLSGSITGDDGRPVTTATVSLHGPVERALTSDADGAITTKDLPTGTYAVAVTAPGFAAYSGTLQVGSEQAQLRVTLSADRPVTLATLSGKRIRLKRSVQFDPNGSTLTGASESLLGEVATLLAQHPEVTRVEVQGHTDDSGDEAKNLALSEARAEAVVTSLVSRGVARERLRSRGFGATRPVLPNITPQNRAINRRVDFVVVD